MNTFLSVPQIYAIFMASELFFILYYLVIGHQAKLSLKILLDPESIIDIIVFWIPAIFICIYE